MTSAFSLPWLNLNMVRTSRQLWGILSYKNLAFHLTLFVIQGHQLTVFTRFATQKRSNHVVAGKQPNQWKDIRNLVVCFWHRRMWVRPYGPEQVKLVLRWFLPFWENDDYEHGLSSLWVPRANATFFDCRFLLGYGPCVEKQKPFQFASAVSICMSSFWEASLLIRRWWNIGLTFVYPRWDYEPSLHWKTQLGVSGLWSGLVWQLWTLVVFVNVPGWSPILYP